jgi:hypothetical protein
MLCGTREHRDERTGRRLFLCLGPPTTGQRPPRTAGRKECDCSANAQCGAGPDRSAETRLRRLRNRICCSTGRHVAPCRTMLHRVAPAAQAGFNMFRKLDYYNALARFKESSVDPYEPHACTHAHTHARTHAQACACARLITHTRLTPAHALACTHPPPPLPPLPAPPTHAPQVRAAALLPGAAAARPQLRLEDRRAPRPDDRADP